MGTKTIPAVIARSGDLRSLKEQLIGPVKVYLETGSHDEEGNLIMRPTGEVDEETGEPVMVPELDTEPFLKDVWYRKIYMTPKNDKRLKEIQKEEAEKPAEENLSNLRSVIFTLTTMVAKWDLTDNGKPIPLTEEAILEADIPLEFIYTVIQAVYEYRKIPKTQTGK